MTGEQQPEPTAAQQDAHDRTLRGIEDGIHKMPAADYHRDPCARPSLSSSIARRIVADSPAHAWLAHPQGGHQRDDDETTPAMEQGTILDSLILGGDVDLVEVVANDWRTNAAKEQRVQAAAEGRLAVLSHKLAALRITAVEIKRRIADLGVLFDGENQLTAVWSETAQNGEAFQARARFDHLRADGITIVDLKITAKANPHGPGLARHCYDFGYDIQAHAYRRALELLCPDRAGRVRFLNVWAEARPPYAVTITRPGGTMRELGARRWGHAVNRWGAGLATGVWPAYQQPGDQPIDIEAPPWTLEDTMPPGGSENVPF